jgi:hypothetical protein
MISEEVKQRLIAQEKAIYSAYEVHDMAAIEAVLADNFREIGSSGRFYSKPDVLEAMKDIEVIDYVLHSVRVVGLDENNAVVTYVLAMNRIENGKESLNRAFRSSVWTKQSGEWRIVFHQATPLPSSS